MARSLQQCMERPLSDALKWYLRGNIIQMSNIINKDLDQAEEIYGIAKPLSKGKMVAPRQEKNVSTQYPYHQ